MRCPRCGIYQPDQTDECSACGIFFSRWKAGGDRLTSPGTVGYAPPKRGADSYRWPLVIALIVIAGASFVIWRLNREDPEEVAPIAGAATPTSTNPLEQLAKNPQAMEQLGKILASLKSGQAGGLPQAEGEIVPGEFWSLRGRVIDVINLGRVGGGRLVLIGPKTVTVPIDELGTFDAEIPQLSKGGYMLVMQPAPGYLDAIVLAEEGAFGNMLEEQRRVMRGREVGGPIQGDRHHLEIGVYPASEYSSQGTMRSKMEKLYPEPPEDR